MNRLLNYICICVLVLLMFCRSAPADQDAVVHIYVFRSPGCTHCEPIYEENIEKVAEKLNCKVDIKYFDIEDVTQYMKLCDLEKKYGKSSDHMPEVFIGQDVFGGEKEAADKMEPTIAKYARVGTHWPDDVIIEKADKSSPASSLAGPAIEFEKTQTGLGELQAGEVVKAIFKFKNAGDQELNVTRVRSSCGCFEQKVSSNKLKPGDSSTVEVDFMTEGLNGDFEKSIMIDTDDPVHPTVRLIIKAKIDPIVVLSPERLNFGTIAVNSTLEQILLVTPVKADGFSIAAVKADGSHVSATRIRKANDGKGSYAVKVVIKAGDKPGRVYERLVLRAYKPDGPTIPFMVFGNVEENASNNAKSP